MTMFPACWRIAWLEVPNDPTRMPPGASGTFRWGRVTEAMSPTRLPMPPLTLPPLPLGEVSELTQSSSEPAYGGRAAQLGHFLLIPVPSIGHPADGGRASALSVHRGLSVFRTLWIHFRFPLERLWWDGFRIQDQLRKERRPLDRPMPTPHKKTTKTTEWAEDGAVPLVWDQDELLAMPDVQPPAIPPADRSVWFWYVEACDGVEVESGALFEWLSLVGRIAAETSQCHGLHRSSHDGRTDGAGGARGSMWSVHNRDIC